MATGAGALSMHTASTFTSSVAINPTLLSPAILSPASLSTLEDLEDISSTSRSAEQTPRNRSRKRVQETSERGSYKRIKNMSMGEGVGTIAAELALARQQRLVEQTALKPTAKAIDILYDIYEKSLSEQELCNAVLLLENTSKAETFLALREGGLRDLWLQRSCEAMNSALNSQ
jgi:hypothetical protein